MCKHLHLYHPMRSKRATSFHSVKEILKFNLQPTAELSHVHIANGNSRAEWRRFKERSQELAKRKASSSEFVFLVMHGHARCLQEIAPSASRQINPTEQPRD